MPKIFFDVLNISKLHLVLHFKQFHSYYIITVSIGVNIRIFQFGFIKLVLLSMPPF